MSTVLWANLLVDGKVECQEADYHALYKHTGKLDSIAKQLNLPSFLNVCDTTDVRFNMGEVELPPGSESTNDVMASEGVWLDLPDAIRMLEGVLAYVLDKQVRFGLIKNAHTAVVEELNGALGFARAGAPRAQKFNFCVVT